MPRPEPILTAQEFADQIIATAREFSETQAKQRSVANDLDTRLIQIGRQRREWKAAEQGIPALIFQAQAEGYEPSRTAVLLGVSPSYVRRILRENDHYSWRVDLFESDAGPGWQPWEGGEDVMPKSADHDVPFELAERILAEGGHGPRKHRSRVLIWAGSSEQTDAAAIHEQEQDASDPTTPTETALGRLHAGLEAARAEFERGQKTERRRVADERGTHADPEDYDEQPDTTN